MDNPNEDDSKIEDLLDPIRPSDGSLTSRDNMSYVYGRDPSILSYSHRPVPSKESKLNLLSAFEEESICHDSVTSIGSEILSLQTVKVYLRMKPFTCNKKITKEEEEAYKIDNKTTLLTKLPCLDNTSVSMKKNSVDTVTRKFTFTETFGPEVTQLDIFDRAMKPMLVKFLTGQNCTTMTYGTTNSGKSFTLQGTSSRPGIIPRSLEYVFANINPRSTPCYKPIHNCDVVPLSSCEKAQELDIKTKLLAFSVPDRTQYINAYKQMQKMLEEESPVRESQSTDAQYIVWVSFTEIYNETIYDLLSNECQKRRPPLKLASDNRGRPFIKGLKQICVNSGSEAYQVLMAGQYNLQIAATALNSRSSRSHCIFTITVLKYYVENKPDTVEISQFSFCDLAGSERLKKTLNVGDRLKEAQNINTSLLVFGRCLKSIYDGQCIKQRNEHAGPFRDSKLTRLFQNALSGKEHMALIVNINPSSNLYVETQNVLNLAAIAKKIVIEPKKIKRRKNSSRFSLVVEQTQKTTTDWDEKSDLFSIVEQTVSEDDGNNNGEDEEEEEDDQISITSEDYQYLMEENDKLKKEIASLKSSILRRDMDTRQEMANVHLEMITKLETNYKNRLKDAEQEREDTVEWSVKQVEEYYKKKLNQLRSRKRKRTNDDNEDEEDDDEEDDDADDEDESESEDEEEKNSIISNLKTENEEFKNKLETLKATNKDLRKDKDTSDVEKNSMAYELSIVKKELKDAKLLIESMQKDAVSNTETNSYINELKSQLEEVQDNNKYLKKMLNEAKSEYIKDTDDINKKDKQIHELEKVVLLANEEIHELRDMCDEANALYDKKKKEGEILEMKLALQHEKVNELKKQIEVTNNSTNSSLLTSITIKQEVLSPRHSNEDDSLYVELQQLSIQDETQKKIIDELQKKLDNTEAENSTLNVKLNEKLSEIESLKNDVTNVKIYMNQVTQEIDDLKNPSMVQEEANQSTNKSSNEIDCQTSFMDTGDQMKTSIDCQTSFQQETTSTSSQTNDTSHNSSNKSMQTSMIDDELEEVKKNFDNMKINFEDLNNQYSTESTLAKNLSEEIEKLTEEVASLREISSNYKLEIKKLTDDGERSDLDNINLMEKLKTKRGQLEQEKNAYKKLLDEKNVKAKESEELKEECNSKHLSLISKLEAKLVEYEGSSNSASQVLLEQKDSLEKHVQKIENLKAEINGLNEALEQQKNEKKEYQIIIENNERKIKLLEAETESLKKKEYEHELEIGRLEKSCKDALTSAINNEEITRLEKEAKNSLKENKSLTAELKITREVNDQFQSQINTLEVRVKNYEMSQAMSDNYQRTVNDQKEEIKELKSINERLLKSIDEKEKEMDKFEKNRQEMVAGYEKLVKDTQEQLKLSNNEVDRLVSVVTKLREDNDNNEGFIAPPSSDQKSERGRKTRNMNNRREKDNHTSDDESQSRRTRRARQLPAKYKDHVDPSNDMSVIELSGSESKRTTRRGGGNNNNTQAVICPSTEKRRGRTVKKLFHQHNDGPEDIEVEEDEPSPAGIRSGLRPRRR